MSTLKKEVSLGNLVGPLIIIVCHVFLAIASEGPHIYPDSGGYLTTVGQPTDSRFGNFNLLGQSLRPWVVVGFLSFFYDLGILVLVQSLIFAISIAILAYSIVNLLQKINTFIIYLVFLCFSLVPEISQFNHTVLSESLVLSLITLAVAFFLLSLKNFKKLHMSLTITFAFLACVIRPYLIIMLLFVLCYFVFKNKWHKKYIVIITSLIILGYPLLINEKMSKHWAGASSTGLTRSVYTYFYFVDTHRNIDVKKFNLTDEAPKCLNDVEISESGPYASASQLPKYCPTGVIWLNKQFNLWYVKYLTTNPLIGLKILKVHINNVGFGNDYTSNSFDVSTDNYVPIKTKYLLPFSLSTLFFSTLQLQSAYFPILFFWILFSLCLNFGLLALFILSRFKLSENLINLKFPFKVMNIFSTIGIVSLLFSILLHPGGEIYRINLPSSFLILLGSLINLFYIFDSTRNKL